MKGKVSRLVSHMFAYVVAKIITYHQNPRFHLKKISNNSFVHLHVTSDIVVLNAFNIVINNPNFGSMYNVGP